MERVLGRELTEDEEVHHRDENKDNNDLANLVVLTKEEHHRLHDGEPRPTVSCAVCGKDTTNERFCSDECRGVGQRRVERPSVEQLAEDLRELPMVRIGEKYGVSDNAVRKWAKRYRLI